MEKKVRSILTALLILAIDTFGTMLCFYFYLQLHFQGLLAQEVLHHDTISGGVFRPANGYPTLNDSAD